MINLQISRQEYRALQYAIEEGIANAMYDGNEDVAEKLLLVKRRLKRLNPAEGETPHEEETSVTATP